MNHIEESCRAARQAERHTISLRHVRRQLHTMDEIILTLRDAAKAGRIDHSHKRDLEILADDVDAHARRVIQLALEIREGR